MYTSYVLNTCNKYYIALLIKSSVINTYIHCTHSSICECEKYHGKKDESYHKAD